MSEKLVPLPKGICKGLLRLRVSSSKDKITLNLAGLEKSFKYKGNANDLCREVCEFIRGGLFEGDPKREFDAGRIAAFIIDTQAYER